MEKEAIVKKLLSLGVMATPDVIDRIEKSGLDAYLGNISKGSCMVVQEGSGTDDAISCRVGQVSAKAEMTPDDFVQAIADKFKRIRDLLLRKMDAVSISNMSRISSKLSVVGMVKEKTGQGFVLEDGTGEVEVKSATPVRLDDVIGVRGWIRDGKLFGEEIVYPDIPVNRPIHSMKGKLLLVGNAAGAKGGADVVVSPYAASDGSGAEKSLPNPAWITLEKGDNSMTVVVYKPERLAVKNDALGWLAKRYIGTDGVPVPGGDRVLETIPDILWIVSENEPWSGNYKGVTLISFGQRNQALIDLNTRKIDIR
ncbi:MAG: hypothetical protein JXC85_05420 [Candidatus Aenigmarchaeota archaeon]|nr:hypothetical protein [Candidatus Aenigmarchaeota archaeon]